MDQEERINIGELITDKEDYESVQESMNKIADIIQNKGFRLKLLSRKMRNLPKGDKVTNVSNKLLDKMYNILDKNKLIDFKELINFGKARISILIYANSVAFLFVDVWHWRYWQYAALFIPINFFINYFLNKRIFKKSI